MPIRPNGFTADLLRKEITAAFGRRWFTRSDCVELLESLYKDGVTGYMRSAAGRLTATRNGGRALAIIGAIVGEYRARKDKKILCELGYC